MDAALRQRLQDSGAVWDAASSTPRSFGDAERELRAALETCVIADRSILGRVHATGRDILNLLHRLTTADLQSLGPGEGRPAVITTPKGRIVERIHVHHLGSEGILMVTGPSGAETVCRHLDRYTFSEDTGIRDDTEATCQLVFLGPRARDAAAGIATLPPFGAEPREIEGEQVQVLGEDGFSAEGISVVLPAARAACVWPALESAVARAGGRPAGDEAVEAWRVLRGLPAGFELTEEHNPLEAGLWDAVSFTKGCYVGQEVVARLRTYDKVSRVLVGLVFEAGAAVPRPGSPVSDGQREVGVVTSAITPPGRKAPVALAYVKRDCATPGAELQVHTASRVLVASVGGLPFGETP